METSSEYATAGDPLQAYIRMIYRDLRVGGTLSMCLEFWNKDIFGECPKLLEHETGHGVIPLDTGEHAVCLSFNEACRASATVAHRFKRVQFDTAEQAEVFAGACRLSRRTVDRENVVMVISPSEAAELNASGCLTTNADNVRIELGNQRLRKLAGILDVADAEHARGGAPAYDQHRYWHRDCGAPACALGHWAAAHPYRWIRVQDAPSMWGCEGTLDSVTIEFALDPYDGRQALVLFGGYGCNGARTAKEAALYLREFVTRRKAAPTDQKEGAA